MSPDLIRDPRGPVLEPRAESTLGAVLECIHPADELGPGAAEIGLPAYVIGQLAGPLARFLPTYVTGLGLLDEVSLAASGLPFTELGADAQEALLGEVGTPAALVPDELVVFFDLVIEHAYEGLFGDPSYGGNAQGAGWQLIGYSGPRPTVAPEHQELGAVAPPALASIYTVEPFTEGRPA